MTTPTCATCRFWKNRTESVRDHGECRRFPPTIWPTDGDNHIMVQNLNTWFPATYETDWCGEHAPRDKQKARRKA